MRALALIAIIAAFCATQSCSRSAPEDKLENYTVRLGRALNTDTGPVAPVKFTMRPRPPPDRSAKGTTIGLIAFVSLQQCQLQQVIAQRNSSLGKLAQPSQRLLNSVDYLRWVGPCIRRLDSNDDKELIAQLRLAEEAKMASLPSLVWRVMLGSVEIQSFWQRSSIHPRYPSSVKGGETIHALDQLTQLASAWLRGEYQHAGKELELHLKHLRLGDGGQLLASAALLQSYMQRANQLLARSSSAPAICPAGQISDRGNILFNVVRLFLIGEVQPWSAQLNRRYYDLWPALQRLEATLATGEPVAYQQWRQRRDALLERYLSSPRRHAERLQPILESCGRAPTRQGPRVVPRAAGIEP